MGLSGLEPPTSRLSGVRSNLLSYKPISQVWSLVSILALCLERGIVAEHLPVTCVNGSLHLELAVEHAALDTALRLGH